MAETDQTLAERVAREAGVALLALRASVDPADDAGWLRDAGDRIAHDLILDALHGARPDDAVLSEEGADDPARRTAERVWIVDPLDGTREYAERLGDDWRDDWAVHVALWQRNAGLAAGAVALPGRSVVHGIGTPAALSTRRWGDGPIRLAISRSHPAPIVDRIVGVAGENAFEFVRMGSAGVKAMAVVTGEVDAYLHDGGQFEWDSAAPVAVAAAAGCVTTRIDGSTLRYNRDDPWLPDLFVSAPGIAPGLSDLVRSAL